MKGTKEIAVLSTLAAIAFTAIAPTAASQSRDEQAVRAASAAWQRYIAAQNVDSIVALHTPDAVVLFANAPPMTGWTAIRAGWNDIVKIPAYSVHWTPTRIDVASPTRATEYGSYTESYDTPNGKTSDAGNYITVWHKVNGKWRIALDAPVSTTPLPAAPMAMSDVKIVSNSALAWSDFAPPGFDPGMKLAVLSGDPGKAGEYVLRLMFPAGYRFPVHWHPSVENLTVVSGNFLLGMGNSADWGAVKTYSPGDFLYIPPRHAHFGGSAAGGSSVIQLHGQGPFQVILGAPK